MLYYQKGVIAMSDILNANKDLTFFIDSDEDSKHVYKLARALASEERIKILRLLACQPMNIYEIGRQLNLPFSTVSNHISVLEDAQIIFVSTQQGKKRHVKTCSRQLSRLVFLFQENRNTITSEAHTIEMPIGHFIEANIQAPCGLYAIDALNEKNGMLAVDRPYEFFTTERFNAELLWFDHGFVSYNFINHLYQKSASKLELSFECCSEITYHREDWPSDISIKINDIDILTFLSPGDFGGRRGKYSPKEWFINSTQYGLLYKITIDEHGTYLNNIKIAKTTINDLDIAHTPNIKVSIGVKENAVHRGGINLFGKKFGDFEQAILLTLYP
jgi:predicted transcriptional regulator